MEDKDSLVLLTVIAGRKKKDVLLKALSEAGACVTNTMYARGTVEAGYMERVFGFVPEVHKVLMTSILSTRNAQKMLTILNERFDFDKPNTGVAFTVPLDWLTF